MPNFIKMRLKTLQSSLKLVVVLGIAYAVGLIFGIIYYKNCNDDGMFFRQVFNYYEKIFDCYNSPISVLFIRVLTNLGYFALLYVLSFTVFTYPISILIIVYRGAIIGCVSGIFISLYSFNGIAVYFGVLLPQNICVTVGMIVCLVLNFDLICGNCLSKKKKPKELLNNCLVGFSLAFLGALYEFLILIVLIRPMNFYF